MLQLRAVQRILQFNAMLFVFIGLYGVGGAGCHFLELEYGEIVYSVFPNLIDVLGGLVSQITTIEIPTEKENKRI